MKSKPYQYQGKLFRYDFEYAVVEYIFKADQEMIEDEKEWEKTHSSKLWDIDSKGFVVLATVGLHRENWKNKEARDEYLFVWVNELDEEAAALVREFEKYELPAIRREMEGKA